MIRNINHLITEKNYCEAEVLLEKLADISGAMDEEYIMAKGFLKRSKILDEKNRQTKGTGFLDRV